MYISRGDRLKFSKNIVFFCLNIYFTFTNSVEPDELQHYAAFHLGLHCLQKYSFRGFPYTKGYADGKENIDNFTLTNFAYLDFCIY